MGTKYQVFLSSTFRDLHPQRALLVDATLKAGHFPVGMEYFAAGGQPKWEYITKLIDSSDYYAVVIADWYGSTVKAEGGISYTEKEFDYAVSLGLKPLVFPLRDDAQWDRKLSEPDPTKRERLSAFKEKAQNYMAGLWHNDTDLVANYLSALHLAIAQDPRTGWVRGSQATSPKVAEELARLSRENEALRQQVAAASEVDPEERRLRKVLDDLARLSSVLFPGKSVADAVLLSHVDTYNAQAVFPHLNSPADRDKGEAEFLILRAFGVVRSVSRSFNDYALQIQYTSTDDHARLKFLVERDRIRAGAR